MGILYPTLPARCTRFLLGCAAFGALIGGIYGMFHDQVSYSISPEYFSKMKFHQFAYANFGWSPRVFVAEVGFLASWWVGMIAGWILGRVAVRKQLAGDVQKRMLKAFAILIGVAATSGLIGISLGIVLTRGDGVADWNEWRDDLRLDHVRKFAIVAYLHGASYIGAVLGLIVATLYLVRHAPADAHP